MKSSRPIKLIGRKRRTLGWTLLTLGLLVAGVWVASGWLRLEARGGTRSYAVMQGTLMVCRLASNEAPGKALEVGPGWYRGASLVDRWYWRPTKAWWVNWQSSDVELVDLGVVAYMNFAGWTIITGISFWPIPLLLWTPAALLLRSGILARRRAVKGMCAKCGYSLAGLAPDAPCPECGKGAGTK